MNLKSRKDLQQANITVEAAFVMPIAIYTVFALIYLAFFLHDKCLIQGAVDKVVQKAVISVKHEGDIESGAVYYEEINERGAFYQIFGSTEDEKTKIENFLQKELSKGLFLSKVYSTEVEADNYKITVKVEIETKVSLPVFKHLFEQYSVIKITENSPVHDPADTIRAAEVILETGSEIKGVDEIKEKIEKFLDAGDD
jgi:hypothetical protein